MEMFAAIGSLFGAGGGGAAAGAAGGAASGAAGAASSAFTIGSILEGGATVLGLVSSISAGRQAQDQANAAAIDARAEQDIETLQGIERRSSLKAAAAQAIGEQDVAYAGSGVDLSFGTAAQAREDVYRETDLGLTSDSGTTMTRLSRLTERARNYRRMGKRALASHVTSGLASAASSGARIAERYG